MRAIPVPKVSNIKELKLTANTVRQDLMRMLCEAGSGHSGGPLGMADVFTALYFNVMKHDPEKPLWEERDRLILSNGHICPVRYAAMASAGYFPRQELMTLRKLDTRLQGHPHNVSLPGIENTGGPLGQGISIAVGLALGAKMDKKKWRVYCMMGDGELDEGQCWEAFMFAGKNGLNNLCVIIDRNNIQIDGNTEDIMPMEPLRARFESFGFHVIEKDAHNFSALFEAFGEAKAVANRPTCIIAHSIPGKGVSFMEYDYTWHGKPPTPEQRDAALKELEAERALIESGDA